MKRSAFLNPRLRQHVQIRRLLQLHCERLLQRTVEDAVAGGIDEIGQQDGILLGQRLGTPRVKEKSGGDRNQQRDHGDGNLPPCFLSEGSATAAALRRRT